MPVIVSLITECPRGLGSPQAETEKGSCGMTQLWGILRDANKETPMQGTDGGEEDAFLGALGAVLRGGPDAVSIGELRSPATMTRVAWEALSDPEAPLLGDDPPDLDEEDGSTRWMVALDALTADYGQGRAARIAVPPFGSSEPYRLTLTENGTALSESVSRDTLDAMQQADEHAEALGWQRGPASPAAAP